MKYRKVRAKGPWVYLERITPVLHDGLQRTKSGLYLPSGNMQERMGFETARVISAGPGIWDEKKRRYEAPDFEVGDIVCYRGFLGEMNHPSFLFDEFCFIHLKDVLGVADPEIITAAA